MNSRTKIPIPKPMRPVGFHEHPGVLDFYVAPGANVTRAELTAVAEEFGDVYDEGNYLRLRINPVFDQYDIAEYFKALYPPYEAETAEARE